MERDWGLESPAPDPVTARRLTHHAALGPAWAAVLEQPTARLRSLALAKALAGVDASRAVAMIDDACSFAQAGKSKHRAGFETVLDFAFSGELAASQARSWSLQASCERRRACHAILELARYRDAIQAHVMTVGLTRFTRLALRPAAYDEGFEDKLDDLSDELAEHPRRPANDSHGEIDAAHGLQDTPRTFEGLLDGDTHPSLLFPLARRYVNLSAGIDPSAPGLSQAEVREAARELVVQLAADANALLLLGIASGPWRRHALVRAALLRHVQTPKPIKDALRAGSQVYGPRASRPLQLQ